jgi:hypothetical protein
VPQVFVDPSAQVLTGPSHARWQVAGSAQRTRQCPPGQSTSQAPLHEISHAWAPSHLTWLAGPTEASHRCDTYWHATVALRPHATLHVRAFWHDAEQVSPPESEQSWFPFAQKSVQPARAGHVWVHEAPSLQ